MLDRKQDEQTHEFLQGWDWLWREENFIGKQKSVAFTSKKGKNNSRFRLSAYGLNRLLTLFYMAGVQGFEPQLTDPESAVLPLNDTPLDVNCKLFAVRGTYDTVSWARCQAL